MKKQLTLVFVLTEARVLLGYKKRGFGQGKWNGFGGKVEPNETIDDAAKRELLEECGLKALNLIKQGQLVFEFVGDPVLWEVHVYRTTLFEGQPIESDEMRPSWYSIDSIPYDLMWVDNRLWLPLLLNGQLFEGYFKLDVQEKIVEHKFEIIIIS